MGALLIAAGGGVCSGCRLGDVRTLDVAPTVLAWLGIAPPEWMEGRPIAGLVSEDGADARSARSPRRWRGKMTMRGFALLVALLILGAGSVARRAGGSERPEGRQRKRPPSGRCPGAREGPRPTEITWYAQALAQGPGWTERHALLVEGAEAARRDRRRGSQGRHHRQRRLVLRLRCHPGQRHPCPSGAAALAKDAPYRRPFGNEAVKLISQGAEKIREEDFHGREAEVYQLTDGSVAERSGPRRTRSTSRFASRSTIARPRRDRRPTTPTG